MNINQIYGPAEPIRKETKTQPQPADSDFQRILDDRLRPATGTEEVRSAATINPVPTAAVPMDVRISGIALTETTIDTLTRYEQALDNPALSATDIKPLVEAMEGEVEGLMSLKKELPGGDPLAKLLERVATVSYVETAKFRRGDYGNA